MRWIAIILACGVMGAGPATKPVNKIQQIDARIDSLQKQVDELRQTVSQLRSEIAPSNRPTSTTRPSSKTYVVGSKKLEIGMTLAEARLVMDADGILVNQNADGSEQYRWGITEDVPEPRADGSTIMSTRELGWYVVDFAGGKIGNIARRPR